MGVSPAGCLDTIILLHMAVVPSFLANDGRVEAEFPRPPLQTCQIGEPHDAKQDFSRITDADGYLKRQIMGLGGGRLLTSLIRERVRMCLMLASLRQRK